MVVDSRIIMCVDYSDDNCDDYLGRCRRVGSIVANDV